ncbi:MAG: hypothetical protein BRC36_04695 [Cyanobacteria bacterium QH_2_48_84]|nr:MAG: hypothetical protein BRC36_04695 [Cyanobacteria bacterium QH_2_48_84]
MYSATGQRGGYIDKTGEIVINRQFDYAGEFSEGLAMVKVGDKWGYIDKTGEMVINPQFDCPPHFNADAVEF